MMDRLFLDANVLFSAAWRPESKLARLWHLDGVRLITSGYAHEEARRNLPDTERRQRLADLASQLEFVSEAIAELLPAGIILPEKDRPMLRAALAAEATHLLTGDRRDFGRYFGRRIGSLIVLSPAAYLAEVS